MNLAEILQGQWNQVAALPTVYQNPDARSLIVVTRRQGWPNEYLEIVPKPLITRVSERMAAAYDRIPGVQLESNDFQVEGISGSYLETQLVGRGIYYLIGAELINGEPHGGEEAELVAGTRLERQSPIAWTMLLKLKAAPTLRTF